MTARLLQNLVPGPHRGRSGAGQRALVKKAYDRATMVEKRRRLISQWADFLTGPGNQQVVQHAGPAGR